MKLSILTLALCALVGSSLAVPPKNLHAKQRTSGTHKLAKSKVPTSPKKSSGIHRLDNEGYIPGIGGPPTPPPGG